MLRFKKVFFFILFLVISIFSISQELEKEITLQLTDEEVVSIIKKIEKLEGIKFSFNSSIIPKNYSKTVDFTNRPLKEILDYLLADIDVSYKEINSQIVLYKLHSVEQDEKPVNNDKNNSQKSVPQNLEKKYIVDTIIKLIYDTITTVNYDTIIHVDTLRILDTIKTILPPDVPKTQFFLGVQYAPVLKSKKLLFKEGLKIPSTIEDNWETLYSYSVGVNFGYNYKNIIPQTGISNTIMREKIDFFQPLLIETKYDSITVKRKIPVVEITTTTYMDTSWYRVYDPRTKDSTWRYYTTERTNTTYDTTFNEITENSVYESLDTIAEEMQYTAERQFSYVDLPIIIGYNFKLTNKLDAQINGGIIYSYLINYTEFTKKGNPFVHQSELNRHLFSLSASIDLHFYLDNKISFYAGSHYIQNLTPLYKNTFSVYRKTQLVSAIMGFCYHF